MEDRFRSVSKPDAPEKIAGTARYVDDILLPGALYAKTFRSPVAHGEIVSLTLPPLPEGCFTVGWKDVPGKNAVHMIGDETPVFAEKILRYVGEPLLLVLGPDVGTVLDLWKRIRLEVKELEPVFEDKVAGSWHHYAKGDPDRAFSEAVRVFEAEYRTGLQEQAYLEPQGMIGYPEGDKITLIGSIQCPYYVKNAVVQALGCAPDKVRVIQPAVGGAFGGKEEFPSILGCQVAVAVRKTNRPVRLIYERGEDVEFTTKRHPAKIRLRAALGKDGKISAIASDIRLDGGAYMGLSDVVLSRSMIATTGAYAIPNVSCSGEVYLTNTVPTGAFRGFGAPQIFFAVEMFMNHVAKDLGEDPVAFRMRHLAKQGDQTATSGTFRDPIPLPRLIETVKKASGYEAKSAAFAKEDSFRGIGLSMFFHGCGFTGSGESTIIKGEVKLKKNADDTVDLLCAAVDMGQGPKTVLPKIAAAALGIPLERVRFPYPDTDVISDSGPTVASRTTMVVGGLVEKAARRLKALWKDGEEIVVRERYQAPEWIRWDDKAFRGDAYPAYAWGVNAIEVSVDPLTLQVKIEGAWTAYDVGKAMDERILQGQSEGGLAQGIAYGCLERMEIREGKVRQKNLTDYLIPTSCDTAPVSTEWFDNPFDLGPFGAKGAGELTLIGGAPAVAMAIENAIGRRIRRIPATPESLLELIEYGDR